MTPVQVYERESTLYSIIERHQLVVKTEPAAMPRSRLTVCVTHTLLARLSRY
jgi:hypothetical protein